MLDQPTTEQIAVNRTRSYGLRVTTGDFADSAAVYVTVMARKGDEAFPINPSSDGESNWDNDTPKHARGLIYAGLGFVAWRAKQRGDNGPSDVHGGTIEYRDVYSVDGSKARAMVKTLDKITRQLDKDNARDEMGDMLMALAKAIGATWTVTETASKGQFYSDSRWRFSPITDARDQLRREIDKLKAPRT